MRDERFKAVRRGGPLDMSKHRLLAAWAADCAEHVLPLFNKKYPDDSRPQRALETARAWARDEVTVGEARAAALDAHAAARDSADDVATAVARAAGHSAATAHMADHAPRAAAYAIQAVQSSGNGRTGVVAADREREWQRERLPDEIRGLVLRDRDTTDRQVCTMANRSTAGSIDEYVGRFPSDTQRVLEELRALIKAAAPGATETISYAMPTFDLNGHHLVHFAGYERHIGLYPVPSGIEAFKEELKPYKSGKGSVQFPLSQPLPTDLIRRIVEFRVAENTGRGTPDRIAIESIVHPGKTKDVDAGMYRAMRAAMLQVLPADSPGLTRDEILEAVPAHLPEDLYPDGAKAGWWSKAVQLDLEAKGVIARESCRPLRWHRSLT